MNSLMLSNDGLQHATALKAMERKTGARGLRTILEHVLLDTMYDMPSMENVSKILVDETVINGENKPYIMYESDDSKRAAAED